MKEKLKWIAVGIVLYFILFVIEQFSPLVHIISWWTANLIIALITGIFIGWKMMGSTKRKIWLSLTAVILGFIVTFIYANMAVSVAEDKCQVVVSKQFECVREHQGWCSGYKNDFTQSNGYFKSWNVRQECAGKLMPFPWNKSPK